MVPLVLVVVMLLGSVLVPARQTWRILRLLREIAEVIEPAQLLEAQLEFGLTVEAAALERYALSGDSALLVRYRSMAVVDEGRLARLEGFARKLDDQAVDHVATVRRRVGEWRQLNRVLDEGRRTRAQLSAAARAQQADYDYALRGVTRLASYLTMEAATRRDEVRAAERLSLFVNGSLVLVALAAVLAVGALSHRQRQLTLILRRRVEEEASLRDVARALGAAATTDEAMRRAAEGVVATTGAFGAYVECIAPDDGVVEFVVLDGDGMPSPCMRRLFSGSLTEETIARGWSGSLREVDAIAGRMPPNVAMSSAQCAGLIAPLSSSEQTFGVLVLLRDRAAGAFGEDEHRQLRILSDLAAAALQRVGVLAAERRALDEAQRRARQEAALRKAAEALAATFTVEEVTQQITRTALEATQARGVFVEQIASGADEASELLVVRASAGSGVPALGSVAPYAGSYTELVLQGGDPVLVPVLPRGEWSPAASAASAAMQAESSAIIVPLRHASAPIGALFVLSATRTPFCPDELALAHTFGHLAALAYEKVRLLDEAREGRRALERVMKSRSRLMRGFSHDVKNPVGAADGYAALLSDGIFGVLSVEQRESIERIRRCLHYALALIDDLHELARAETGHIALSLELVDLAELTRASGEEYRAAAEANGLSLSVDVGPAPLTIETDRTRVRQIVSNLLSNAIKYTLHGSVTLRVQRRRSEPTAEAEPWAAIDVSDTGRGIPQEKQAAIFEEFIRLGGDETSGAGLGLAISQRLAQALGGRITVQSEVGHGSTFTLWLPLEGRGRTVPPEVSAAVTYEIRPEIRDLQIQCSSERRV